MPPTNQTQDTKAAATAIAACPQCLKLNRIALDQARTRKPVCGACRAEIDFHDGVLNASGAQLGALIKASPSAVVVDFWAPWCGPCRAFAPTFAQVAQEDFARATFVKLNTEADPAAAQTYGIRGIPTLMAFRRGQELARQSGAFPYAAFKSWIASILRT